MALKLFNKTDKVENTKVEKSKDVNDDDKKKRVKKIVKRVLLGVLITLW